MVGIEKYPVKYPVANENWVVANQSQYCNGIETKKAHR